MIRGLAGFLTVVLVDLTGVLVFLVFDPDPVTTFNSGTTGLTSSTIGSTTDSTTGSTTGITTGSTLYGATGSSSFFTSTGSFGNFFQK